VKSAAVKDIIGRSTLRMLNSSIIHDVAELSLFESCWKKPAVTRRQKSCQDDLLTKSQQLALHFINEGYAINTFDMLQHTTFNSFCQWAILFCWCFAKYLRQWRHSGLLLPRL